MLNNKTSHLDD